MSVGADLTVQVVSVVLSFLLTCIVGGFVWYFRKYVISEIEENSAHRRRAEGENPYKDTGRLDRIDEHLDGMEQRREKEHREVRQQLKHLREHLRRVAAALNQRFDDDEVTNPETGEPDYFRGDGGGSENDD